MISIFSTFFSGYRRVQFTTIARVKNNNNNNNKSLNFDSEGNNWSNKIVDNFDCNWIADFYEFMEN